MKNDGRELFSYVPCKPFRNLNDWGFTRPVITDNQKLVRGGYISQDLNQNFLATDVSYDKIRLVWMDIVEQVKKAELSMMVQTDMPVRNG